MPKLNGFEVIELIDNKIPIVIISSDINMAAKAFNYDNIVDFLSKPLDLMKVIKSINRLNSYLKSKDFLKRLNDPDHIFIKKNKILVKIDFDEIVFIKALGDYIIFKTINNDGHIVRKTLKSIASQLSKEKFEKVHRSYIVNINYIDNIEDNKISIRNENIPIGRKYKLNLVNKINKL